MTDTPDVEDLRETITDLQNNPDPSISVTRNVFDEALSYYESKPNERDTVKQLAEALDSAVVNADAEDIDWDFLLAVAEGYPPADITKIPMQYPVSNVLARNIIRERTWSGTPNTIPTDALRYLRVLDWDIDGDYAAENKSIYAWGWGHPEEPVEYKYRIATNGRDITALIGGLPHLLILDQEACTEFVIDHVIESNYYYDQNVKKPDRFSSAETKAERNYEALNEIYGSLKNIGQRKVNDRIIDSPNRPLGWSIFDFRGDFTYSEETLTRLHDAFPEKIVTENGPLNEPFTF